MCGINGFMSLGKKAIANGDEHLSAMNRLLQHRGPDDEGKWSDTNSGLWLGHRRLSIIDLSAAGHQPMQDELGNTIVFNGEIYNYKELRSRLSEKKLKSDSDTEILLNLYSQRGHQTLELLNGMFAFAFWNSQKKELLLARDRAGKKPLYYSTLGGIFSFSSEIKALLALPWINAELDDEAMYHFLTFNQLSAPSTMFKGIHKLAAGECMTVNESGIKEKYCYWDVEFSDLRSSTEKQLEDRVFDELNKAVNYRMVADVPVGAFLSGGVDSSAVVALMRQQSNQPIKTYSIGFEGQPDYDELKFAEKISKQFGTEHFERIVKPSEITEFLPKIVEYFDEPMADATCIPIYFISQLARENGTIVVQTGDGADELFAGYRGWMKYNQFYPWFHRYSAMPKPVKKMIAAIAGTNGDGSPLNEILQRAAHDQEFFWGGASAFKEHSKGQFLNPAWAKKMEKVNSYSMIENVKNKFDNHKKESPYLSDLDWMCYYGFKELIPNRYLYRMDRLGMANSIEIRSPFLDYNLVNLALSLPGKMKLQNNEPKYLLKKSLERILPNEILYRKKMGFCVPLKEWANETMLQYTEDHLHDFCSSTGIFDEKGTRTFLSEIKNGNTNYTNQLWTIYFLMAWFNKWMNNKE